MTITQSSLNQSGDVEEKRTTFYSMVTIYLAVLIVLSYVGNAPFSEVAVEDGILQQIRRLVLVLSVGIIGYLGIRRLTFLTLPTTLLLLLCWMWYSTTWSVAPDTSLARIFAITSTLLGVYISSAWLGGRRSFRLFYVLLAVITVVSVVSALVIPGARHTIATETNLVGNWKGILDHKNFLGVVCSFLVICCLSINVVRRNYLVLALAGVALIGLWFSSSKTCILILLPAIGMAWYASVIVGKGALFRFVIFAVGMTMTLLAICGVIFINDILALFDERSLTGRWSLWSELWQYIQEVFWLGSGYGGLWDVPSGGPFERYATGFAAIAPHAHNMYIDMLAQTGFVGMVLFLGLILGAPMVALWRFGSRMERWQVFFCLSVFVFVALHNVLESSFFRVSAPTSIPWLLAWVMLVDAARGAKGRRPLVRHRTLIPNLTAPK